jgi:hypothetical protein
MKELLALCAIFAGLNAFATGTYYFQNTSKSLAITSDGLGGGGPTATNANGFYYGLFVAPLGTTDPGVYSFSGNYATNLTFSGGSGRIVGGLASIEGIEPGERISMLVRGWSSSLGHDWSEIKNELDFGWSNFGFYGESSIGSLYAGGGMYPSYPVMGQLDYQIHGITLYAVPEPSALALITMGLLPLLRRRRAVWTQIADRNLAL